MCHWETGKAGERRNGVRIFPRVVCFRLKRFDILKIPSEQPFGCSDFFGIVRESVVSGNSFCEIPHDEFSGRA